MKNCLMVVLLMCYFTSFSQKNKVGVSFSPELSFRIYKSEMGSIGETWGLDQQPKIGYTFTAHYERELTKNWSLISGLIFTNKGYQSEKTELRFSDQPMPAPSQESFYYAMRYKYSYYQIGIPVGINYYMRLKKVNLFLGGGACVNYLANVLFKRTLYSTNASENKTSKTTDNMDYYTRISFSAFAQGGIELNLPRNLKFRISPNVSYSLTNVMDKKVIYKIYPYSMGIGYGVLWGF